MTSELVRRLRAAGCVYAEDEAAVLLESAGDEAHLESMVVRRITGEPLEHVVGWAEFAGIRVRVDTGVFVPRRRTEALVTHALRRHPEPDVVVDLCCGSGALGLAFLSDAGGRPELHAADLTAEAVACARQNLAGVGVVHQGDLFGALPDHLRGRIDVLLANTPYVPTAAIELLPPEARLHEPRSALDGGPDGLNLARRVITEAAQWLAPGGSVHIEVDHAQAPALAALARDLGMQVAEEEFSATRVVS